MNLYHYYESETGPFRNLSDLSNNDAQKVLDHIKKSSNTFAAKRFDGYLQRRAELEQMARKIFITKGGKPLRTVPHYMVVEQCDWLETWYKHGEFVAIPISEFDTTTISFSYGDMFPTFSPKVTDHKEYREQIYTYNEILDLIHRYGLPQIWNSEGKLGPERYIEVQVWSNSPLLKYC